MADESLPPAANRTMGLLPTISLLKYKPDDAMIRKALGWPFDPDAAPPPGLHTRGGPDVEHRAALAAIAAARKQS